MIILILVLLGLCFGSFVNALVYRLHEQGKKKRTKELSIINGRSICVHCKHVLAPHDLLPVVSWLSLGGKCRYCRKPISWQYPVVELLTAGLFVFSYLYWPYEFDRLGTTSFVFWLVLLIGFVALTVYDLRWMILPNKIVYTLFVVAGLSSVSVLILGSDFGFLWGSLWGFLIGGGLFYVLFQVSNGKWIGGGDVKLGALLGIIVGGPMAAILFIFLASVSGSLVSAPLIITKKLKPTSKLPFGPFLLLGAFITYLFGASMIAWYQNQLLL